MCPRATRITRDDIAMTSPHIAMPLQPAFLPARMSPRPTWWPTWMVVAECSDSGIMNMSEA
jgi:hypothetical protein